MSTGYPVQRSLVLDNENCLSMLYPEHADTRSQDLPVTFHDAGQFYWGKSRAFLEGRALFSKRALPLFLPRERVVDIDTPEDWRLAEVLYDALNHLAAKVGNDTF